MTSQKIPRIDYPKRGELKSYILISKAVKRVRLLSKEVIKSVFSPKQTLSNNDYEDHVSKLHGKILGSDLESVEKSLKLSGKELVLFVNKIKTSKYK